MGKEKKSSFTSCSGRASLPGGRDADVDTVGLAINHVSLPEDVGRLVDRALLLVTLADDSLGRAIRHKGDVRDGDGAVVRHHSVFGLIAHGFTPM